MRAELEPILLPVTGREELGTLTEPEQALAQFYKALNDRDLALMEQNWDPSPEAAMDNPLGGINRGWAEIRPIYARMFSTKAEFSFELWDYTKHRSGEIFWVVGRERGSWATSGEPLRLAIRTTRLFRRDNERWRQLHHHGSIEDPEMLARYISAIREP